MISSFHLPESSANARRISSCMLICLSAIVCFSILATGYSSYLRIQILADIFDERCGCTDAITHSEQLRSRRSCCCRNGAQEGIMASVYIYWVSTTLLCLLYLTSTYMYATKGDWVRKALADLGYPAYLVRFMIVVKIVGPVAIVSRFNVVLSDLVCRLLLEKKKRLPRDSCGRTLS